MCGRVLDVVCFGGDRQVLEVMAATRDEPIEQLAQTIYDNTVKVFFSNKK